LPTEHNDNEKTRKEKETNASACKPTTRLGCVTSSRQKRANSG
jgi:hypothetical protein